MSILPANLDFHIITQVFKLAWNFNDQIQTQPSKARNINILATS